VKKSLKNSRYIYFSCKIIYRIRKRNNSLLTKNVCFD